ncbi:unnamed protein product [Dicrocoelium dendriticum]|nr:unnamed protein product [Dicrocoelium dendriticum]
MFNRVELLHNHSRRKLFHQLKLPPRQAVCQDHVSSYRHREDEYKDRSKEELPDLQSSIAQQVCTPYAHFVVPWLFAVTESHKTPVCISVSQLVLKALAANNVDLLTMKLRERGCQWYATRAIEGQIILHFSRNTTDTWKVLTRNELHSMLWKQSGHPNTSLMIKVGVLRPEGHRISRHGAECDVNVSNVNINAKDFVGADIDDGPQKNLCIKWNAFILANVVKDASIGLRGQCSHVRRFFQLVHLSQGDKEYF